MTLITELTGIVEDYKGGTIQVADGLAFSTYRQLRTIDFYSSSMRTGEFGNKDELGREIPFYNTGNVQVDVSVVATDIDTKDIAVEADDEDSYYQSFMFNHEIQDWMKEAKFAKTLNEMGEIRARYGGVVIKRTKKGKEMKIEAVDWKNLVVDQCDFDAGYVIEKHYLTPGQLRAKSGVWKSVNDAIGMYANKAGYTRADKRIEVWEVEGSMPESFNDETAEAKPEDKDTLQRHFYAVKGSKQVHLFWEEIPEKSYKYLPWKRVPGRMLGRGVIEEGEQAQIWTNDAIEKETSAMELASKIVIKTNSNKFGNNIHYLANGSVIKLEDGKDASVLNLLPAGVVTECQNLIDKWWSQTERANATYDAVRGETPPSGQAYRLQALIQQQAGSHFDYRREEWGIFLQEVFYDWVFPHIKSRLTRQHILASDFSPEELLKLDEDFAAYEAKNHALDKIAKREKFTREDYLATQARFKEFIKGNGDARRFIDIPEGYYDNMQAKLSINITGEQKNKQAIMESLSTIMQSMVPMMQAGVVTANDVRTVLNKLLELSGAVSPISLSKMDTQAQAGMGVPPGAPQGAGAPVGAGASLPM